MTRLHIGGGLKTACRLHISGVLAVLPVDAFTGQPVCTRDFTVEIKGERAPVRKSGGFFVFSRVLPTCGDTEIRLSEKADTVTVRLAGRGYREMTARIRMDEIRADDPVLMVPVNPDRDYPFPLDIVCMEGRIPAHSCLKAALLQKKGCLRMTQDYSAGGPAIALCGSGRRQTAGNLFFIGDAGGESVQSDRKAGGESAQSDNTGGGVNGEFVRFGGTKGDADGSCPLREPLTRDFDIKKARLYPARMQEAGEREEDYFFAFRVYGRGQGHVLNGETFTETGETCTLCCRLETPEEIREYQVPVRSGETKNIDF